MIPSNTSVLKRPRVYGLPNSQKYLPEFSKLLMAILSLKRTVMLNYAKFSTILEERSKQEIESLNFDEDPFNEVSFTSNSTNSDEEDEVELEEDNNNDQDDDNFIEKTKDVLDKMKSNERDLKHSSEWEELLLYDCTKRRRIQV